MRSRLLAAGAAATLALSALSLAAVPAHAAPSDISSTDGTSAAQTVTSDWGSGYCANITVSTASASPITWQVTLPATATINNIWDAQAVGSAPSGAPLVAGVSYDTTVTSSAPVTFGYCASVSASPTQPALVPVFTPANTNSTGFSVQMTNYDPAWTYTIRASNGTATQAADTFAVSGLTSGQTSTLTVSTSRTGYDTGVNTVTATASGSTDQPLILVFGQPVPTVGGFTAPVTNYDCAPGGTFTCAFTTTAGTVAFAAGGITVTGLTPLQSATVTATTTATGYAPGTSTVTGAATDGTAPATPIVFATPVATADGFTVQVSNNVCDPSGANACTFTSTAGTATASGNTVTVTGLAAAQTATLTGTVSSVGQAPVSTTVVGHAQGAASATLVGPYVDMGLWPPANFTTLMSNTGANFFTAAFVMHGTTPCVPTWGGYDAYNIGGGQDNSASILAAESAGTTIAVSFGGLNEKELAETCTDTTQLTAAYNSVAERLNTNMLDFDIEGGALGDRAQNQRRAAALAALQQQWNAQGKTLHVSVTLATTTTGLDAYGQITVQEFLAAGVSLSRINLMVMDYGPSYTGDMGEYAITATEGLQAWMSTQPTWAGLTDLQLGNFIGMTPMIGQNDVAGEIFTIQDARSMSSWVDVNNIGMVGWWEATRDQPCASATSPLYTCSGVSQAPWAFANAFVTGIIDQA